MEPARPPHTLLGEPAPTDSQGPASPAPLAPPEAGARVPAGAGARRERPRAEARRGLGAGRRRQGREGNAGRGRDSLEPKTGRLGLGCLRRVMRQRGQFQTEGGGCREERRGEGRRDTGPEVPPAPCTPPLHTLACSNTSCVSSVQQSKVHPAGSPGPSRPAPPRPVHPPPVSFPCARTPCWDSCAWTPPGLPPTRSSPRTQTPTPRPPHPPPDPRQSSRPSLGSRVNSVNSQETRVLARASWANVDALGVPPYPGSPAFSSSTRGLTRGTSYRGRGRTHDTRAGPGVAVHGYRPLFWDLGAPVNGSCWSDARLRGRVGAVPKARTP